MNRPTSGAGRTALVALPMAAGALSALIALTLLAALVMVVLGAPGQSRSCSSQAVGASAIGGREIPRSLVGLFMDAAARYRLGADGWLWLAAVNSEETDFGRNLAVSSAGALGWMQFMPDTWARYGVDGNHDGRRDPNDPADAIPAAASYLQASGAPTDWHAAVLAYNHAEWYFVDVQTKMLRFRGGVPLDLAAAPDARLPPAAPAAIAANPGGPDSGCGTGGDDPAPLTPGERAQILPNGQAAAPADAPPAVRAMVAAGNRLIGRPYLYGGAHGPSLDLLQPAYDCSSTVSYLLHAGGTLDAGALDSGSLARWGAAGSGAWVTIYANAEHTFMYVASLRMDTSYHGTDTGPNAGQPGPRWRVSSSVPNWATWAVRHPPGL